MDGNKRTAIFVANSVLIRQPNTTLLAVPVDEADPTTSREFNDRLARAYVFGEYDGVKDLLRQRGFSPLPGGPEPSPQAHGVETRPTGIGRGPTPAPGAGPDSGPTI